MGRPGTGPGLMRQGLASKLEERNEHTEPQVADSLHKRVRDLASKRGFRSINGLVSTRRIGRSKRWRAWPPDRRTRSGSSASWTSCEARRSAHWLAKRFQADTDAEETQLQSYGVNLASRYGQQIHERQDLVIELVEACARFWTISNRSGWRGWSGGPCLHRRVRGEKQAQRAETRRALRLSARTDRTGRARQPRARSRSSCSSMSPSNDLSLAEIQPWPWHRWNQD